MLVHLTRAAFSVLLLVSILLATGCVERKLMITSEPAGADVWVNEQWHGKTPYELPFKHYGTFGVRVEKAGYYPIYVEEPITAPLYQRIGPDLISEAVLPNKIEDDRRLHYVMRKIEAPDDIESVISRADDMISKSDPVLARRLRYDLMREEVHLPLPVKNPNRTVAKEAERNKKALELLKPEDPKSGKSLDSLDPIEPIK